VWSCDPAKKRPLAAFILFYIFVQGACGLAACVYIYIYTCGLGAPGMPGILQAKKWGADAPRVG